ncbi:hypothetical protein XM25_07960 [Devosia sp. H5989]|nr:hypothetical protein XM25_07960 [Devosia sp. H5989]
MTAKPKTSLKVVEPDTELIETGMASAPDLPVVPTIPTLDEAAVYRAEQQQVLDKAEADLWVVDSEMKSEEQQFQRQVEILTAKRDANVQALELRQRRLSRIKAGCEAALKASED